MKSNYVIQAEINIKQHPEWDVNRRYKELKYAYEKANYSCYWCDSCMIIIPNIKHDNSLIKVIQEV